MSYSSLLSFHLSQNTPFLDLHFPPLPFSKYTWKRISEIHPSLNFMPFSHEKKVRKSIRTKKHKNDEEVNFFDVVQGELGDCYFIASLVCLSENPNRIKRLLVDCNEKVGIYSVRIFDDGEWKNVIVDDFLPCYNKNQLCFSRPRDEDEGGSWVMILEKAWAKLNGSYENIESGLTSEGLRLLTGAPTITIFHDGMEKNQKKEGKEELWIKMTNAFSSGYIIVAGAHCQDSITESKLRKSLVAGHVYSILGLLELPTGDKLIKLRNPWGDNEWKGAWGDNSPKWTEDLMKLVEHTQNTHDGVFWMDLKDYWDGFAETVICMDENSKYASKKQLCQADKETHLYKITIRNPGSYFISLTHANRRKGGKKDFEYPLARLFLAKGLVEENEEIEFIEGKYFSDYYFHIQAILSAGDYLIYTTHEWKSPNFRSFVLGCYGPDQPSIESLFLPTYPILQKLYLSVVESKIKRGELDSEEKLLKNKKQSVSLDLPPPPMFLKKSKTIDSPSLKVLKNYEMRIDEGYGYFYAKNQGSKKCRVEIKLEGSTEVWEIGGGEKKDISLEMGIGEERIEVVEVGFEGYRLAYTELERIV